MTDITSTVASLNRTSLVYAPQSHNKYSNAAIATVGYVLEEVQGEPFASYLKRSVLAPMGLRQSAFEMEPSLVRHLAVAEMWTYHGRVFDAPGFQLGIAPAGSMYATMPDLAHFMSVLFAGGKGPGGQVLKPASLDSMWTPQFATAGSKSGYGIGFALGELDGERVVRHGGAIYGFATELAALPGKKLGVAISISRDGANAVATRIANEALRMMIAAKKGQPLPEPAITSANSMAVARRVAGRYGRDDNAFELVRRDSTVSLRRDRGGRWARLRLSGGDSLIVDDVLEYGGSAVHVLGDGVLRIGRDTLRREVAPSLPPEPTLSWRGLIGEYGWDHNILYILEKHGRLTALIEWFFEYPLTEVAADTFAFPHEGLYNGERLIFARDSSGRGTQVEAASVLFKRRAIPGEDGGVFRIAPLKAVDQLLTEFAVERPLCEQHVLGFLQKLADAAVLTVK